MSRSEIDLAKIRERSDAYFSQLDPVFKPRQVEVDRRDLLNEIERLTRTLKKYKKMGRGMCSTGPHLCDGHFG